jgi:hypothetical protein
MMGLKETEESLVGVCVSVQLTSLLQGTVQSREHMLHEQRGAMPSQLLAIDRVLPE